MLLQRRVRSADLAYGPFATRAHFDGTLAAALSRKDSVFFAVTVAGRAVGWLAYLAITPESGSSESDACAPACRCAC